MESNYHSSISKVKKHIAYVNIDTYDGLHWIKVLDTVDDEPCISLYCWKYTKAHGKQIKCVGHEFIDHNDISDDLSYSYLSGYQVLFDGEKKKRYGYIDKPTGQFHSTTDLWYPSFSLVEHLFIASELQAHFKDKVPYLIVPNITNVNSPMELLRKYRDSHLCEMITKAGFPYLCQWEKGINRLSDKKKKELIRWINDNKGYMFTYLPIFKFIIMAMKNKENGEQCRQRCMMENDRKFLKSRGIEMTIEQVYELDRYLEKQGLDIVTYADYFRMSEQIGRNMKDRGVLFPHNLMEQHDRLQERFDRKRNRHINKLLKQIKPKLEKYALGYKGLKIVIPQSQEELVKWGNTLHNCVGTMGYGEKMANGKCIILGVFRDGVPVECCELQFKEKSLRTEVVQLRGDHNQPSQYHDNAQKLIDKFVLAFKPKQWIGVNA